MAFKEMLIKLSLRLRPKNLIAKLKRTKKWIRTYRRMSSLRKTLRRKRNRF